MLYQPSFQDFKSQKRLASKVEIKYKHHKLNKYNSLEYCFLTITILLTVSSRP